MMTESNGRQMTLNALLDEYEIVIPIIQRDYAHGREEEADVRNGFLDTLYEAITPNGTPTVLDYIYGSIDTATGRFLPIDGQQITTAVKPVRPIMWMKPIFALLCLTTSNNTQKWRLQNEKNLLTVCYPQ